MTSTIMVQNEIERFLRSVEPEVLCITGDWGVGKTYTWQAKLDRLRTSKDVGLSRYSYVSLFGINSIDGIKQSIFENMEFIIPEGKSNFDRMMSIGNTGFQQSKKLVGAASAIPYVGDAIAKITQPFLFSSIRNQIICIDDLERAGKALQVKDIFGLMSYLREQKGCKIVLLLNETKLDPAADAAKQFNEYFEKVIDAKVVFAPTPDEAAGIAFPNKDDLSKLVANYSVKLGIKNIRVLKKIERLISIVIPVVDDLGQDIRRQVVQSLVMFGWAKFDSGAEPPPMNYLKRSSLARYMERSDGKAPDAREQRWDAIISGYEFENLDDFDLALLQFVESSILDADEMRKEAEKQDAANKLRQKSSSLKKAFRLLHDTFDDNGDEVCVAMVSGIKENFDAVSLPNIDEVAGILHRIGKNSLADDLIQFAENNLDKDAWLYDDPFNRPMQSERIREIIAARKEGAKPVLNFEEDLVRVVNSRDDEVMAKLAAEPVERYVKLFDSKTGDELRRVVLSALDYRKILNATDDQREIVRKAEAALLQIGKRSKINAVRVQKYGIVVPEE